MVGHIVVAVAVAAALAAAVDSVADAAAGTAAVGIVAVPSKAPSISIISVAQQGGQKGTYRRSWVDLAGGVMLWQVRRPP